MSPEQFFHEFVAAELVKYLKKIFFIGNIERLKNIIIKRSFEWFFGF
jgi:hypothetical protein